jgi:UDP-N-acetylmuramoyl-tripeptide--D-alanyl-D-alanine ligase
VITAIISLYGWNYPTVLVYMLQSCEYRAGPYLRWYWRTQNFRHVMHRRTLDRTRPARLMLIALRAGMSAQIVAGFVLIGLWHFNGLIAGWQFGLALILSYPIVWAHLAVIPLILGREISIRPKERRSVNKSAKIFARHQAIKIAVAGSYGKTSMKEILKAVLGEGKKVAATPANKNVALSHAKFAHELTGEEEVIIIEYGEGKPGDVRRFTKITQPTHAVITGVAPAHLDRYRTIRAAGRDIFSVADYLGGENVYVNGESPDAAEFIKPSFNIYNAKGALGCKVKKIKLEVTGTSFDLTKGKRKLRLKSGLLGKHQVGPLALAAALALDLGLSDKQVKDGMAKTVAYEHRMQPYLLNGAWIIDDTYNGNIEGVRAGTELLAALPAKRKFYVTPGLVDQGSQTRQVHHEMGKLIAQAKPNKVVLMKNSVTSDIKAGLEETGYKGELIIEIDPLVFYKNLDQFVAAGDIMMMQNDWTDNYA